MSSSPTVFFVPTLDIDLAWHTHQLGGSTYHNDCIAYVGRYIDQWVLSSRSVAYLIKLNFAVMTKWRNRLCQPPLILHAEHGR